VIKAMGRCNGNIAHAADLLGITRPTLYNLLDKFGLRKANEQDRQPPVNGLWPRQPRPPHPPRIAAGSRSYNPPPLRPP
jgi:hypothetical protein